MRTTDRDGGLPMRLTNHQIRMVILAIAVLLFLILPFISFGQVIEPKQNPPSEKQPLAKKTPIVPTVVQAKGGKLFAIDASKASGMVLFRFDKKSFPDAIEDGKKLYLVAPKLDEAASYTVTVISFEDKSVDDVVVSVPGDKVTPPVKPPTPVDLTAILHRMDKIESRLTALEQIKPIPPPIDPFIASLQAAYEKDGKPAIALTSLTAVYRQSLATVNNTAMMKASDILTAMHTAAQSLIGDQLPTVRRVLGDDANINIGRTDKVLDATMRATIAAQFLRSQRALEGVK